MDKDYLEKLKYITLKCNLLDILLFRKHRIKPLHLDGYIIDREDEFIIILTKKRSFIYNIDHIYHVIENYKLDKNLHEFIFKNQEEVQKIRDMIVIYHKMKLADKSLIPKKIVSIKNGTIDIYVEIYDYMYYLEEDLFENYNLYESNDSQNNNNNTIFCKDKNNYYKHSVNANRNTSFNDKNNNNNTNKLLNQKYHNNIIHHSIFRALFFRIFNLIFDPNEIENSKKEAKILEELGKKVRLFIGNKNDDDYYNIKNYLEEEEKIFYKRCLKSIKNYINYKLNVKLKTDILKVVIQRILKEKLHFIIKILSTSNFQDLKIWNNLTIRHILTLLSAKDYKSFFEQYNE